MTFCRILSTFGKSALVEQGVFTVPFLFVPKNCMERIVLRDKQIKVQIGDYCYTCFQKNYFIDFNKLSNLD